MLFHIILISSQQVQWEGRQPRSAWMGCAMLPLHAGPVSLNDVAGSHETLVSEACQVARWLFS